MQIGAPECELEGLEARLRELALLPSPAAAVETINIVIDLSNLVIGRRAGLDMHAILSAIAHGRELGPCSTAIAGDDGRRNSHIQVQLLSLYMTVRPFQCTLRLLLLNWQH